MVVVVGVVAPSPRGWHLVNGDASNPNLDAIKRELWREGMVEIGLVVG